MARCEASTAPLPKGLATVKRAVVGIQTTLGSGSGVFVSPDGFVLTAAHVVGGAKRVDVILADGTTLAGEVVRKNGNDDVALIRAATPKSPCRPLREAPPATGDSLWVIGSPLGDALAQSVTQGIVSATRSADGRGFVQTDASINEGNSGGPMFDADGTIAAVVSFKAAGAGIEGLGFGLGAEFVASSLGVSWEDATADDFPVRLEDGQVSTGAVSGLSADQLEERYPELLEALKKYKHRHVRVQDTKTTYYSDGNYAGTSYGWRITGANRGSWPAEDFMELVGDSQNLSKLNFDRKKNERQFGIAMLGGGVASGVGWALVGTGIDMQEVRLTNLESAIDDWEAENDDSLYFSEYSSSCADLPVGTVRLRCSTWEEARAPIVAGAILATAGAVVMGVDALRFTLTKYRIQAVSTWYDKESAAGWTDKYNRTLGDELGLPPAVVERLLLLSYHRTRPKPTIEGVVGFSHVGLRVRW